MGTSLRRIFTSVAAWLVGASASVAVGMLALSAIDSGPAIHAEPLAPLVAPGAGTYPTSDPTPSPSAATSSPSPSRNRSAVSAPTTTQRQFTTDGGTVLARCTGSSVYLLSWSPAQDYRVGRVRRGPGTDAEVAFFSHSRLVDVHVDCVSGVPQAHTGWDGHGDD